MAKQIFLLFVASIFMLLEHGHASRISKPEVSIDFLYWHATETADWSRIRNASQDYESVTYKTVAFDWSPGFRVGLGYDLDCSQWNTQLYYTWFHTKVNDHINAGTGTIESLFLGNKVSGLGSYQNAKLDFDLSFNMFDWDLGRDISLTESLVVRPFIGIKGGWINQSIDTYWEKELDLLILEIPVTATENLNNNFRGAGIKGGFNTKWVIGVCKECYFSFFGDFTAAYLWGNWTIKDEFHDIFESTVFVKVKNRNFGALMLQGFMGFGLDFDLRGKCSHLSFKLGYEIQDWFNQYQVFDNGTGAHNNDLLLQGLTLDMRLDF